MNAKGFSKFFEEMSLQAGAELCQAKVQLEVVVEIGVEVEAYHYLPGWVVDGGLVGGLKSN